MSTINAIVYVFSLKRAVDVSGMIDECAKDIRAHLEAEERRRAEGDEGDYDDGDEDGDGAGQRKRRRGQDNLPGSTFTIVCSRSLVVAVSGLVVVIEKAVAEVEALFNLRDKQRKSILTRAKNSSIASRMGTLDGHISSDDEDDSAGVGMRASVSAAWTDADEREYRALITSVSAAAGGQVPESAFGRYSSSTHSLRGLNRVDDTVFMTLHRLFEAASCVLHPVVGDATERVLGLFCKLFKMQTRVTRALVSLKVDALPPRYQSLANFVSQQCAKRVDDMLVAVSTITQRKTTVDIRRHSPLHSYSYPYPNR
jgi:hypothetical protein